MWTESSWHEGHPKVDYLSHLSPWLAAGNNCFYLNLLLTALTMGESAWHRMHSSVTSWAAWGQHSLWAARPWPPHQWVSAPRSVPRAGSYGEACVTPSSPLCWLHLLEPRHVVWE